MKAAASLAILALAGCAAARSEIPAIAPLRVLPLGPPWVQQQGNAGSANQDTSATSGDQITKPAGQKGATLIGCLAGPDKDGKYVLHNMNHREGVQILGPDDLNKDSGAKVKLTGQWQAASTKAQAGQAATMGKFQVTDVEVMAKTCSSPSATTPASRQRKQKPTTYDATTPDDSK